MSGPFRERTPKTRAYRANVKPKKPLLRTGVAERHLTASRDAVWAKVTAAMPSFEQGQPRTVIDAFGETYDVTEVAISHEAPWRLVVDVTDGPIGFHQESVVIVPDPAGCIAMWSVLAGPDDDAAHAYAIAVTDAAEARLADLLQEL